MLDKEFSEFGGVFAFAMGPTITKSCKKGQRSKFNFALFKPLAQMLLHPMLRCDLFGADFGQYL